MLLIARDQLVRAGSIGALHEYVVVSVARDFQAPCRSHGVAAVPDELE